MLLLRHRVAPLPADVPYGFLVQLQLASLLATAQVHDASQRFQRLGRAEIHSGPEHPRAIKNPGRLLGNGLCGSKESRGSHDAEARSNIAGRGADSVSILARIYRRNYGQ